MLKKILWVVMMFALAISLTACGSKAKENAEPAAETAAMQAQNSTQADGQKASGTIPWPVEFKAWGVPILSKGIVTVANNKSISGDMITQGVNAVVNLKGVAKEDWDAYCKDLEAVGFVKNSNSLADVMVIYEKNVSGGVIKMTLSYDSDITTIMANNSAAASVKEASTPGKTQWPDAVKAVPEFSKGKFKEALEMGGGMYAITFTGVTEVDLEEYRNTLKKAGFQRPEAADTEVYLGMSGGKAYSVGFVITGDTVQFIALIGQM